VAGTPNTARTSQTATLLLDGRVLVVGGHGNLNPIVNCEIYSSGLDYQTGWRPVLNNISFPPFPGGGRMVISGSGFRGYGNVDGSGGGTNSSTTNFPMVQLRRPDNEQIAWLTLDPAKSFTSTSITAVYPKSWPAGQAFVTVFVNGVPSQIYSISIPKWRTPLFLPYLRK
jgi:hypothetical protein